MDDLIETVQQYKVIYDPKCKEYRDQSIRAAVREEIGEKIKQLPEKCKDDWNKLRNSYVNALKRRKKKRTGQAAAFVTPWKYEEQMSFLRPYMESRPTTTNLMSPPESPESYHSETTQSETTQSENSQSESRPATPHSGSFSHSQRPVRNKRNLEDLYDLMKSSHDLRLQKQHSKQQGMDETDLFFLSMSKAVKGLPKLDQTKIKLDLHTAVSHAEIRKLHTQAKILKTPIHGTRQIVSQPQQQLRPPIEPCTSMPEFQCTSNLTLLTSTSPMEHRQQLQPPIEPSTSMPLFPATSALTLLTSTSPMEESASTLEENNISSYYSNYSNADYSDDN